MNNIRYRQIFDNFYIDEKCLKDSLSFNGTDHDYIHVKEAEGKTYCWVDKIPEVDQSIQKFVHRLNQESSFIADFEPSLCFNENLLKLKQKIKRNNQQPLTFLRRFSRLVYNIYCLFYHRVNRFERKPYERLIHSSLDVFRLEYSKIQEEIREENEELKQYKIEEKKQKQYEQIQGLTEKEKSEKAINLLKLRSAITRLETSIKFIQLDFDLICSKRGEAFKNPEITSNMVDDKWFTGKVEHWPFAAGWKGAWIKYGSKSLYREGLNGIADLSWESSWFDVLTSIVYLKQYRRDEEWIANLSQKMDPEQLAKIIGADEEEIFKDYENNKEFVRGILKPVCSNTDDKICKKYAINFIKELEPKCLGALVRILQEEEDNHFFIVQMIQLILIVLDTSKFQNDQLNKYRASCREVEKKLGQVLLNIKTENICAIAQCFLRMPISMNPPFNPSCGVCLLPSDLPIALANSLLSFDLLSDLEKWLSVLLSPFSEEEDLGVKILKFRFDDRFSQIWLNSTGLVSQLTFKQNQKLIFAFFPVLIRAWKCPFLFSSISLNAVDECFLKCFNLFNLLSKIDQIKLFYPLFFDASLAQKKHEENLQEDLAFVKMDLKFTEFKEAGRVALLSFTKQLMEKDEEFLFSFCKYENSQVLQGILFAFEETLVLIERNEYQVDYLNIIGDEYQIFLELISKDPQLRDFLIDFWLQHDPEKLRIYKDKIFNSNSLVAPKHIFPLFEKSVFDSVKDESPFAQSLRSFIDNSQLSDIQLRIRGRVIAAHRCVLQTNSFFVPFLNSLPDQSDQVLDLSCYSLELIQSYLTWTYSRELMVKDLPKDPQELNTLIESVKGSSECVEDNFSHFFKNERYSDIKIRLESGEIVAAHRIVLAVKSAYFNRLFTNGMQESQKEEIHLIDIADEDLIAILTYCYTSHVELTADNVVDLLLLSNQFELFGLMQECEQYLITNLDKETAERLKEGIPDLTQFKKLSSAIEGILPSTIA